MNSRSTSTTASLSQLALLAAGLAGSARGGAGGGGGGGQIQLAAVARECPTKIHPALQPHWRFGCPAAMDEETAGPEPVDWSPWTHPPECIPAGSNAAVNIATNGKRDRNATVPDKYCVYTNAAHGHRGVSLITTPETAASIVDLLDDFNAEFMRPLTASSVDGSGDGERQKNDTARTDEYEGRPYRVVEMPEKGGKGVLATRRIRRAEVVMVDFASLVLDLDFPRSVRRLDGYELLTRAADRLADPGRVLGLARKREHPPNLVEDVVRTNAFHFELDGKPHMALYADVARINHACKPNVYFQSSQSSLAARVIAFRDIEAGEELTLSYIDLGKTHADRQRALQRWGFTCTCAICTAKASEIAESDARRSRIQELKESVVQALSPSPSAPSDTQAEEEGDSKDRAQRLADAISHAEEALSLARAEELRSLYAEQHDALGRLYWAAGDRELAVEHARLSLEVLEQVGYVAHDPAHLPRLLRTYGRLGVGGGSAVGISREGLVGQVP